ncbi:MAG: ChaN family lipoprotein [Acidobacteria bacterium]|nr:ChaN family lipoprotein [Acidobacteriota bacterium]
MAVKSIAIVAFLLFMFNLSVFSQANEAAYRVYDATGKAATLDQIIEAAGRSDVVFLGENHDDATAHALQLQIFRAVVEKYGKDRRVALSMEMFERDVQIVVNEYLNGLISENHFLASSRPWNNYKQDYRPLVELAREKKLPVIAANAPRRYVNMVSRNGRDSLNALSSEAKKWLAPLPFSAASEAYTNKFKALMGKSPEAMMGIDKIMDSQALWDATMSFSVGEYLKSVKNSLVVHLNGAFHTENRLGTAEQLLKFRPKARVLVVTIRYEDDFTKFDQTKHAGLGDFVILTDSKVPRSFKQSQ